MGRFKVPHTRLSESEHLFYVEGGILNKIRELRRYKRWPILRETSGTLVVQYVGDNLLYKITKEFQKIGLDVAFKMC